MMIHEINCVKFLLLCEFNQRWAVTRDVTVHKSVELVSLTRGFFVGQVWGSTVSSLLSSRKMVRSGERKFFDF